jgi:hypothetical protein
MKIFIVALSLLLLATTATAQRLVYVAPAPQATPSTPAVVVPGLVFVPSAPLQPQTGTVTDSQNRRFFYQENAPQSGSYWVYPMQTSD